MNGLTSLFCDLAGGGFRLRVEGGNIIVAPSSRVSSELRDRLVAHKPELLEMGGFHGGEIPVEMWRNVLPWRSAKVAE